MGEAGQITIDHHKLYLYHEFQRTSDISDISRVPEQTPDTPSSAVKQQEMKVNPIQLIKSKRPFQRENI